MGLYIILYANSVITSKSLSLYDNIFKKHLRSYIEKDKVKTHKK